MHLFHFSDAGGIKVFTPRAVASLESLVRETIDRYASRLDPSSFDAVEDFAALFPVEVVACAR